MNHSELNTNGTDYVSDREFDALISELQSITEEARATDYHDTLRKAALFLNLLKSKVQSGQARSVETYDDLTMLSKNIRTYLEGKK